MLAGGEALEDYAAGRAKRELRALLDRAPQQAHRYTDALTAAFAELAEAPKSAAACDHIRAGYRRRGVERHVIYFRITVYGIAIVRILHGRMDALRHL